jgi:hypothetical protein
MKNIVIVLSILIGLLCALPNDQYLTHYWPIENGTMLDAIGSAVMSQGNLTLFTTDRFGNENSALALNYGWTQVPPGIYFDTPEFTISVWVYPQSVGLHARVIDFANLPSLDNVILMLDSNNIRLPGLIIYNDNSSVNQVTSSQPLELNQWQLLTATFNGTLMMIYINGSLTGLQTFISEMRSFSRSNCFVGQSNKNDNSYSSSYLDELRLYNKSLNETEISYLMDNTATQTKTSVSLSTLTTSSQSLSYKGCLYEANIFLDSYPICRNH